MRHSFPTRQLTNETAANVIKLLTMMTRMPDAQVEYLFNNKLAYHMMAASEEMVEKAQQMIDAVDGWYPGGDVPKEEKNFSFSLDNREWCGILVVSDTY